MIARFPRPLLKGDTIGITAFSSGVTERLLPRLDHIVSQLQVRGYRVDTGQCLRKMGPSIAFDKGASASAIERAGELNEFLHDPKIAAIAPPWGGELAIQVLPLIDFARLTTLEPKWLFGFSDVSTLMLPLTLCAGWATLHCSNLMDLSASQRDPLTNGVFDVLTSPRGNRFVQHASTTWQRTYIDWASDPQAGFNLTEPTEWKLLTRYSGSATQTDTTTPAVAFEGRLIGGCLDTVRHLAGTDYGDVPAYIARNRARSEGTILYLENCELAPFDVARTLAGLRLAGWLDGINGLLLGRSSGPEHADGSDVYAYHDALRQSLGELACPVIYDVDIGHRQPQLCLINGARAKVTWTPGRGSVSQEL